MNLIRLYLDNNDTKLSSNISATNYGAAGTSSLALDPLPDSSSLYQQKLNNRKDNFYY